MLSWIRKRLTFANVVMTLALVFAMSGGAYAAKHYLITSTKQISPKVLKQLEGKTGLGGPKGAAGPAGPAGPAGAAGEKGPGGPEGKQGPAGPKGETGTTGQAGPTGQTGFTDTLPSGKTEKGAWSFSTSNEGLVITAVSFGIPLAKVLSASAVHYVGPEGKVTACPGTAAEPKAEPGNLCVYQGAVLGVQIEPSTERANVTIFTPGASLVQLLTETSKVQGASTNGAGIQLTPVAKEDHIGWGAWAVTAP
jgi:Collagen triple helix repeat (20 copies)